MRRDPYFRAHYTRRVKYKGPQTAIVAVARRLLEVTWHVLTYNRPYEVRPVAVGTRKVTRSSPAALM